MIQDDFSSFAPIRSVAISSPRRQSVDRGGRPVKHPDAVIWMQFPCWISPEAVFDRPHPKSEPKSEVPTCPKSATQPDLCKQRHYSTHSRAGRGAVHDINSSRSLRTLAGPGSLNSGCEAADPRHKPEHRGSADQICGHKTRRGSWNGDEAVDRRKRNPHRSDE
jgi:hypothetical protein